MCLLSAFFQWRDHVRASNTGVENKMSALEQKEQELQAFIQQLSMDLQKVSGVLGVDPGCWDSWMG